MNKVIELSFWRGAGGLGLLIYAEFEREVRWSSKVVEIKGMDLLDLEKKFQKKISSGKYFFELG